MPDRAKPINSAEDATVTPIRPIASTERAPTPAEPALTSVYEAMDRVAHAGVARSTLGLSPSVLGEAWMDCAVHLAMSAGKSLQLMEQAMRDTCEIWASALGAATPDTSTDRRFSGDGWQKYPFNVWSEAHRRTWRWWQGAMTGVHGVAPAHEDLMAFVTGFAVDATSPSNFAATNPDVIAATVNERGQNLTRGARNLVADIARRAGVPQPVEAQPFAVGRNLATAPGKVVFRNDLIELIQYAPTTDDVRPEPILIVPAWIMKYYILDLSEQNSLVRFLVGQGFTVFMVSWKNPDAADRDLSMEDYRQLGVMAAMDAAQTITKAPKLHAVGYCLGGTLLSIAAAAMGRDGDDRLASVTLLAAQVDFTETGPLRLFIDDSEVTLIEDMMADKGYLSSEQMAGAFALLRARDLIWAPAIRDYFLGERGHAFDLMTWNADATRMPARMHSEYLRRLFLDNDLAEGHYMVGDKAIAISDIRAPVFAVGTEDDHVAPWPSVYKLHLFVDVDMTFVLTSGGHNAGIVSEPGHPHRHFRIAETRADATYRSPEDWRAGTAAEDGSWWPAFADWLSERSAELAPPPPMGARSGQYAAICDAPGTYVMQT